MALARDQGCGRIVPVFAAAGEPSRLSLRTSAWRDTGYHRRRAKAAPKRRNATTMNNDHKKTVLRMIPYGIYVLTADDGNGKIAAATVNWVTQTAFSPPLVVVGVKADSGACAIVKQARTFALNMLGKDQKALAFTFFRPADLSDGKISGQAYRKGTTGAPILSEAPGAVECRVTSIVEQGDHHIVVGEVIEAHLHKPPAGRPDVAILEMKDLGDNVFYGG
jgi:flavin reductase (DIM6/NTAB) family NADH-FMN oxidoreductase RutF